MRGEAKNVVVTVDILNHTREGGLKVDRRKVSVICGGCEETFEVLVPTDVSEFIVVCPHCSQKSKMQNRQTDKCVRISGWRDDLITVEGMQPNPRVNLDVSAKGHVACSDGTLLEAIYDEDGIWRFTVVFQGPSFIKKEKVSFMGMTSDVVYLQDNLKWIIYGTEEIVRNK